MPVQRIESNPRMSAAVIHADLVFLAGQVPDDRGLGAAGQTREVLAKIDRLLARRRLQSRKPAQRSDLAEGHRRRLRRHERGLERLAASRLRTGTGDGTGASGLARGAGRDHGDRCARLTTAVYRSCAGQPQLQPPTIQTRGNRNEPPDP